MIPTKVLVINPNVFFNIHCIGFKMAFLTTFEIGSIIPSLNALTIGCVILVNALTSESFAFINTFLTPCTIGSNDLATGSKIFFLSIPYKKSLNSVIFSFNG